MPDNGCPVNAAVSELDHFIHSGTLKYPKSRRRVEDILALMRDIAGGRAGKDHLSSLKILADELGNDGADEICKQVADAIRHTLTVHQEVFLSHVVTHNCATGACTRLAPAPCQITCPAGLDIPTYVTLIGMGLDAEAIDVIRKDNPFPWVCGLVCTRPCEFMCVRGRIDEPISIKFLKAFAAERAMSDRQYLNPEKEPDKGRKVCIIGAGPGGMSAAYYLALRGYGVTVIESLPIAGGMMMIGIPRYRLPREVIDREVAMLEDLGIEFRFSTQFGKDITLDELEAEGMEAYFFAIGAHKSFLLNIPGEQNYPQVLQAIDVLKRVALGERKIPGKNIVVIGGGNVAIDAARTCLRLGCDQVTLAYRRTRSEMPADIEEVEQAEEEGIHISFLTIPAEILGENGKVTALRCIRAEMITQEGSNRKYPVPVEGSDYLIETDIVISAIGQQVDQECLSSLPGLKWTRRNTLDAGMICMETAIPGIFAAGDAVTGPATVIEAIGGGKRAADAIHRYLSGIPHPQMPPVPVRRGRIDWLEVPASTKMILKRPHMPVLAIDRRRTTFQQVELGYSENMVREEARRCLRCDVCLRCGKCVEICRDMMGIEALQMGYIDFDHPGPTDFRITEERCILCGACAANCPTQAIRIEDRKGERILSLCGTILNRQKLTYCEKCGADMGPVRYIEYVRNKTRSVIPFAEVRSMCDNCARKSSAGYLDEFTPI